MTGSSEAKMRRVRWLVREGDAVIEPLSKTVPAPMGGARGVEMLELTGTRDHTLAARIAE